MPDKVNAAGCIFVFFHSTDDPIIGLQQREDTEEWSGTGGIIESYDDVGLGMEDTIMNCIQRECLEELGTTFNLDNIDVSLPDGMISHYKQKLDDYSGDYYTVFISLNDSGFGDLIDNLNVNPSEVYDFEFRELSDWLSEPKLHSKVREILQ
jgi:8-oxo-dGTP pyrophosphatase MutT (NUDIX family)